MEEKLYIANQDSENVSTGVISDMDSLSIYRKATKERKNICKIIPSEEIVKKFIPDRKKPDSFESAIIRSSNFAVLKYILGHLDLNRINKILLSATHELSSVNVKNSVKHLSKINNVHALVNLSKINEAGFINRYFSSINEILPDAGIYIGCVETVKERNRRLHHRKKPLIAGIKIFFEYIWHRVIPKIALLRRFYFRITHRKYRFLTTAETLGRLVSCGFEIIEFKEIRNLTYFVVMKTRQVYADEKASYGPFIKEKKVTSKGKVHYRYKFRIRHPYSEYVHDYVLRLNASYPPSALPTDFRFTFIGKAWYGSFIPFFFRVSESIENFVDGLSSVKVFPEVDIHDLFYIKHSLGKGGKQIKIYKFRTMVKEADKLDNVIVEYNSHGNPKNDPRITRLGRVMRKVWIDELPQLYSLIKGDIKLVGIRPMRECDWERYPEQLRNKALQFKPGLMGIQYGTEVKNDFREHLDFFNSYLDHKNARPVFTDVYYFFRILYYIFFKGVRSD